MVFPQKFLWGTSNSGFQFEMGDSAARAKTINEEKIDVEGYFH